MAWTTPGTATAGEVLTAAFWNTNVRDNSIMGSPVYTNEAARDAAIPAPSEGMQCYLTAPTVPSASGDTYAATPTGVQTIYNGSVWVCVTPLSATTNTGGTSASTSWTATLTSGGTNPSLTLVTGTQAQVCISAAVRCAALADRQTAVSLAVSGATTLNPSGTLGAAAANISATGWGAYAKSGTADTIIMVGRTVTLTGLTAGTNTFAMNYITDAGTFTFANRTITVQGIA